MEINKLTDYISVYDNVFGDKKNKLLYRLLLDNYFPFEESKIFTKDNQQSTNTKVRSTKVFPLGNLSTNNNTVIHWANLFASCLIYYMDIYQQENNTFSKSNIQDIQLLKYEKGGFYKTHVDSGINAPRTLSFIYFVNDDYENGNLIFELPQNSETVKVEVKKDRLLVWPSNFLYPHKVEPVTKGVKFSVVSWAL